MIGQRWFVKTMPKNVKLFGPRPLSFSALVLSLNFFDLSFKAADGL